MSNIEIAGFPVTNGDEPSATSLGTARVYHSFCVLQPGKSSVKQMIMGAGKTSVVSPLLLGAERWRGFDPTLVHHHFLDGWAMVGKSN